MTRRGNVAPQAPCAWIRVSPNWRLASFCETSPLMYSSAATSNPHASNKALTSWWV